MRRPKSPSRGRRATKATVPRAKYDLELQRMAMLLMDAPFNRPGAEKGIVSASQFAQQEFFRQMREARGR